MKPQLKPVLAIAAVVLLAPTVALATPGNGHGKGQGGPEYAPSPPPQGNAYGRYCQDESKKHLKGEKGTAFSRCVTSVAQAANHPKRSPGQVCKGKSKKHAKGEKGTEFSRCVDAVAHLRRDERREEREEQQQP